jgi:DNA modification methylase
VKQKGTKMLNRLTDATTTRDDIKLVEIWPIDRPTPNPHNARVHSEEQIAELATSLREYKFTRPLLVDENGVLLAGHGTLQAARHLGLSEVPVIVIAHLTELQKRAYLIADNQLALNSDWDEEKLGRELAELEQQLVDLKVVGFSPEELDRLLADLAPECLVEEDSIPEIPKVAITIPGELWVLGRHRVLCGDALSAESFDRVMQGQPAAMVFSDFPYNVNYQQKSARNPVRPIANDNLGAKFEEFLHAACVEMLRVTEGAVYLCMSSSELHTLHRAFTAAGGHWSTFVIWSKDRFTVGRSDYQRQYEPILYGWKEGGPHFWCGARNQGDVWLVPKPRINSLHPTMKPVSLMERAIRNSSRRGDTVLDPFGGVGSTLLACEKTGRAARMIELEPRYVDAIVQRWEAYTGQEAHRESDGRSFALVAEDRTLLAA